ncbi:MAG: MBL fold metallo-hydrolase [Oscillospiraceae bacterium]|nr:MBL fold metallo-hydrolase [Oscillospiraceae bacterium]
MKIEIKKEVKYIVIAIVIIYLAVSAVVNAIKSDGNKAGTKGDVITVNSGETQEYPLEVYFVDVGQGDGTVIKNGDVYIVIDGGEKISADAFTGTLKSLGVKEIDLYVASHPHSDHIGAAAAVFDEFDVKSVMTTTFSEFNIPTTKTYELFLTAVDNEDCDVIFAEPGDSYTFGDITLDIFAPLKETNDYNNMSVVFKLTYGKTSFLFTGDAEKESEALMLSKGYDLSADVLKLGHHGSSTSTSEGFFNAVSPSVAVISCGKNNNYGHPHRETVALLEKSEIKYYRTDECGTVVICSDGKNIIVKE